MQLFALMLALAWGHGEDKLGPNQGFVKMPGGFHTELVKTDEQHIKVYLLDLEFKNPSTKDSKVEVRLNKKGKWTSCPAKENFFACDLKAALGKGGISDPGTLQVQATREKQKGNVAEYALPLTLHGNM